MRQRLVDLLVCPACLDGLRLEGPPADAAEAGTLACAACHQRYPVTGGIPRFVAAGATSATTRRTRDAYTFAWHRFGERGVEREWEKDSYRYLSLVPPALMRGSGRLGLDAGCGAGQDLVRVAAGGAEIVGLDLSGGVDAARRLTAHLSNVHLVQADIARLPFGPATFDFVYSLGVLHHLPDPGAGLRRLARLLRPGGALITYLYEDFGDRSVVERAVLSVVRLVRRVTPRLPPALLYALCCLTAPLVWVGCSVPAWLLRRIAPALVERIPFRHTLRWSVLASDLFDRFAVPVEFRYSRQGVQALYAEAGLVAVESVRYRGWVSWGFKPSAVDVAHPCRGGAAVRGSV